MSSAIPQPPSSRAEILLLTLFAGSPHELHFVQELQEIASLIVMGPQELAECLEELRGLGFVARGPDPHTITLTPHAFALVLELSEARLTDDLLRQRPLQEQAEALVIWSLADAGLPPAQHGP